MISFHPTSMHPNIHTRQVSDTVAQIEAKYEQTMRALAPVRDRIRAIDKDIVSLNTQKRANAGDAKVSLFLSARLKKLKDEKTPLAGRGASRLRMPLSLSF